MILENILIYQLKNLKKLNNNFLWDSKEQSETTFASLNCGVHTPELMIMLWCFVMTAYLPLPLQWKILSQYELINNLYI